MNRSIVANVLFVRDLETCAAFYRDTFGLDVTYSDAESVSFKFGEQFLILLNLAGAADLLKMEESALQPAGGPRGLLATGVDDVDAFYEQLKAKGVTLLRPPTDQPWGLRTAHFADPEGAVWEINQPIPTQPESDAANA